MIIIHSHIEAGPYDKNQDSKFSHHPEHLNIFLLNNLIGE